MKDAASRWPWTLNPGPQTDAYTSEADELYFGGQAHGGKTALLLMLAATQHTKSIIFRRTFKQLTGADGLVQKSHEFYDLLPDAQFVGSPTPLWRLPGGRLLEFGAVEREDDKTNYKGRGHDLKAFDEMSEFTESQYLFLIGWARTNRPDQRVRIVGASNPPTSSEGLWVVRRWAPWLDPGHSNPAAPGELRWFARIDNVDTEVEDGTPFDYKGETLYPKSRTFIPSSYADNPYTQPDYVAQMQALPEPLRSQVLYGDHSVSLQDHPWQVIPTAWIWKANERWREWEAAGKPGRLTGIGADIGGGKASGDPTVFARAYDVVKIDSLDTRVQASDPNAAITEFAGELHQLLDANPLAEAIVDAVGIGLGVLHILVSWGKRARGFIASLPTALTERSGTRGFVNARMAAWWLVREMLDPDNGVPVCLPPDEQLKADLTAPRYSIAANGKFQLESKESLQRRLGRSTDAGDSVVQALAGPVLCDEAAQKDEYVRITYDPPRFGNY